MAVSEAVAALLASLESPSGDVKEAEALAQLQAILNKRIDNGLPSLPAPSPEPSASSRGTGSKPSPVDAKRVEVDVAGAGIKAISEYPLLRQGEEFGNWLTGFMGKAAAVPLSDEQKLDLLSLRLDSLAASFLRMCRTGRSFSEACRVLMARMSPRSDVSLRDSADLALIRQEDNEGCYAFYIRLCEAYGRSSTHPSDDEFKGLLSSKLNSAAKDYIATLEPRSLDQLIHALKVLDQTRQAAASSSVNVVRLRCFACGGFGHRESQCPRTDEPFYPQPQESSNYRGRGRGRRGRARGRRGYRGGGYYRGSSKPYRGQQPRGSQTPPPSTSLGARASVDGPWLRRSSNWMLPPQR